MSRARAAACAALLGLAAPGCRAGPPAPFTVRAPLPPPPPAAPEGPPLRALVLGDFGDDTRQQAAMGRAVASAHARAPVDLVFSPGDNLYECGPDVRLPGAGGCAFGADGAAVAPGFSPPQDPRFERLFERAWPALARGGGPVPVYLALGNHDVAAGGGCAQGPLPPAQEARLKACLEVAHRSARWTLPARHFVVERGPARFIVLDSNLLLGDYGGFTLDEEVKFLRQAAEGCAGRPCFVVAHHPAATAGGHRGEIDAAYRERLGRLEEAAQGHLAGWLAGHDHDLQHLRAPAGYDVLVSGNGARGRPSERFEQAAPPGAALLFASTAWGLLRLDVWSTGWAARFEAADGAPLHCCRASSPGPCVPVGCAGFP